jgi:hypothetical protein
LLEGPLPLHSVLRALHIDAFGLFESTHACRAASPAQSQAALLTSQQKVTLELPPYVLASTLPLAAPASATAVLASTLALVPPSTVGVAVALAPFVVAAASTSAAALPATPPSPAAPTMRPLLTPLHPAVSTRATRATRSLAVCSMEELPPACGAPVDEDPRRHPLRSVTTPRSASG